MTRFEKNGAVPYPLSVVTAKVTISKIGPIEKLSVHEISGIEKRTITG